MVLMGVREHRDIELANSHRQKRREDHPLPHVELTGGEPSPIHQHPVTTWKSQEQRIPLSHVESGDA
jgi:hypothetical protein